MKSNHQVIFFGNDISMLTWPRCIYLHYLVMSVFREKVQKV